MLLLRPKNSSVHDPRFEEPTVPSLVTIEMNCSDPSELSGNILLRRNSIILTFLVCSSLHVRGRNGYPKTLFCFGLELSSATPTRPPLWRSVELLGSRRMKSGRVPHHCCLGGTVLSLGAEEWDLVFSAHHFSLLSLRCNPQAHGCLLHQACGGSSAVHVSH